jgi:hypothetical protein
VDVGGMQAKMVHQSRDIVGPDFHIVLLKWSFRLPVTAHIKIDAAKCLREDWRGCSKIKVSEASAMDLDDRIAFAGLLVPDSDTVDSRVRHWVFFGVVGGWGLNLSVKAPNWVAKLSLKRALIPHRSRALAKAVADLTH